MHAHRSTAFSLVELSIVLVILGLLVGGILAGQSLIRAAELRAVGTEQQRFITATNAFRDRYFALPGDMTNATSVWGAAHATPATCITTVGTGTQTCNGSGNGLIQLSAGSNEPYRFWQHLTNAGLIEGSFSGVTQGSTTYSSTNANSPTSRIASAIWMVDSWGIITSGGGVFDGVYGNIFSLGMPIANSIPYGRVMTPPELWNLDTKLDDGKPATGQLVSYGTLNLCTDTSTATNLSASYLLSSSTVNCNPLWRNVF